MRRFALRASLAATIGLVIAPITITPAHAEIYAGRFGNDNEPDIIAVFPTGADGNVAPLRVIGGPATGLASANGLAIDRVGNELYVADFQEQRIVVFDVSASGNVAPLRSITSPQLGQPRGVAIDRAHDELFTVAQLCCLATFARDADGSVAPTRFVSGAATELTNPGSPVLLADRDEIAVPDFRQVPGLVEGEILVFARLAAGNVAPLRIIRGADTHLGDNTVWSVAYDAAHGEIIALVNVPGEPFARAIVTHAVDANGNATPLRVISGDQTALQGGVGLAYDDATETILVSNNSGTNQPSLVAFPRLASGNVAPLRHVTGGNVGAHAFNSLAAFTRDALFDDDFE
jgi:hypothetical protein